MEVYNLPIAIKKRFCKDNNINIQVFDEPYFSERIELLGYQDKINEFIDMFNNKFNSDEQKYFEYYNSLKDNIINYIKESTAFQSLNSDDMNNYAVKTNIRTGDIFKVPFIGRKFVSIDIQKANFSSLVHYAKLTGTEFNNGSFSWKNFINRFTDIEYFESSKYIRQVVFGNCNPKRQVTYEKFVMNKVYEFISDKFDTNKIQNSIVAFCNDELVFDVTDWLMIEVTKLSNIITDASQNIVPLHFQMFQLGRAEGTDTFLKSIICSDSYSGNIELKCNNPIDTILITRIINGQDIIEHDLVFESQFGTAKLLKIPDIRINFGDREDG